MCKIVQKKNITRKSLQSLNTYSTNIQIESMGTFSRENLNRNRAWRKYGEVCSGVRLPKSTRLSGGRSCVVFIHSIYLKCYQEWWCLICSYFIGAYNNKLTHARSTFGFHQNTLQYSSFIYMYRLTMHKAHRPSLNRDEIDSHHLAPSPSICS